MLPVGDRLKTISAALNREISGTTVVDLLILGDGTESHRLDEMLTGRRLTDTRRHSKHVFARYGDDTGCPALHFGMTGSARVVADDELPQYAYVQLYFADGGHLAFRCPRKFARVRLIDRPEALDPERFMLPHRYGDERFPDPGTRPETEQVSGRTGYYSPARQPLPE